MVPERQVKTHLEIFDALGSLAAVVSAICAVVMVVMNYKNDEDKK